MATSPSIHLTLHSTIGGGDGTGNDPAEVLISKIQDIRKSVTQLREDTLDYERIRDQYIIHLQQCQEDHSLLRGIFKRLKYQFDLLNQPQGATPLAPVPIAPPIAPPVAPPPIPAPPVAPPPQVAPVPIPPPPPPQIPVIQPPVPTPVQEIPAQHSQTIRRMPTIENFKPTVDLIPEADGTPNDIKLRYALNTGTVISCVQFSPDGTKIAFADPNFVYLVSTEDGDIFATITLPVPEDSPPLHPRTLKFSPDKNILALSGAKNEILLYNVDNQKLIQTLNGHTKEVSALIFNQDGSWLISGGLDGNLIVWDTKTFQCIHKFSHSSEMIVALASAPDAEYIAVGFMNGSIGIYGGTFTDPMTSFTAHNSPLMDIAISPLDGISICSASQDKTAKIWVLRGAASCKSTLSTHTDYVLTATFAPSALFVFTGSKDSTIKVWAQKTGKPLYTIKAHGNTLFEIAHHPTDNTLVSCSGEGLVCVWDYSVLK